MRGRTNVAGKPEEERTVTAGTSAVTVEPTKGKTMKKITVDPTPSQTKTVTAGTGNVNVSPDSGKLLSGVTVKPTPTQEKTVTPTTSQQTVLPDSGKHLSKVTVKAKPSIKVDGTEVDKGMNLKSTIMYIKISDLTVDDYPLGQLLGDEIHLVSGTTHLKIVGETYTTLVAPPANSSVSNLVNYKGALYYLTGSSLYKWVSGTWTIVATLPTADMVTCTGATADEDYIYFAGDRNIYTWDGSEFTDTGVPSILLTTDQYIRHLIVSGGYLHAVSGANGRNHSLHKKVNGQWELALTAIYASSQTGRYILTDIDGVLYRGTAEKRLENLAWVATGLSAPLIADGSSGTRHSTTNTCLVIKNGEIHMFANDNVHGLINAKMYREALQ